MQVAKIYGGGGNDNICLPDEKLGRFLPVQMGVETMVYTRMKKNPHSKTVLRLTLENNLLKDNLFN